MKPIGLEELVRIALWMVSAGLVKSGYDSAPAIVDMLSNEAVVGAVMALALAVWRLWRGATPEA